MQQRALGNKNILSERDWFKKNEARIRLENVEKKQDIMNQKMDLLMSRFPK